MTTEATTGFEEQALCPNTGEPCPAAELLVELYSEELPANRADEFDQAFHPFNPILDEMKLSLKLAELSVAAKSTRCPGPIDKVCPTRERMNNSQTRQNAVSGFRGIKQFLRIRGSENG